MKENYKKIDENTVEISVTTTTVEKTTMSLDDLEYNRESLVKTMIANQQEVDARNADIQVMIDRIDDKIFKFKELGVVNKSEVEIQK